MIKILLADDHQIIRTGLRVIIQNNIVHSMVEEAWDGESVLDKVSKNEYSLIMLDICMPNTDTTGLVKNILDEKPRARILMCSMYNEEIYARRYLQIGAVGYVNKSSPEAEIKKAIENVLDDKRYISPGLLEVLTHDTYQDKFTNPFDRLSKREIEILDHLVKGQGVNEISDELDIGVSTVGTYKARVFDKLNCKNVLEIITLAGLYNFNLSIHHAAD